MPDIKKKNILIAPLDWGLGHTTRCIPIICELINHNCTIIVAGNAIQIHLLKQEFPELTYLFLEGYNVHYSRKRSGFLTTIARQLPGIARAIKKEQEWLKKVVATYRIDGIISDNRFGLHHKNIPSVFITHQLAIQTPFGLAGSLTRKINYRWINRFTCCWIPDFKDYPGLAGGLSHPPELPSIPCYYTGPLSRMKPVNHPEKKRGVLIVLSGPEPQRTLFEQIIVKQLQKADQAFTIVRGLPKGGEPLPELSNVVVYDHLAAAELNQLMGMAEVIVCRSGYSSVMDVCVVGAKAVMVPTPGQTEQEYLAALLARSGTILTAAQDEFDLNRLVKKAKSTGLPFKVPQERQLLKKRVHDFVDSCGSNQ